jgi:hypothetical protein
MLLLALSAIGFYTLAGCAAPVDDGDPSENVTQAEQGLGGTYSHAKSVPCTVVALPLGQMEVDITNNTGAYIVDGEATYTIYHYGTTVTYHGSGAVSDLANGDVVTFNASSDPNTLSASTCTAILKW